MSDKATNNKMALSALSKLKDSTGNGADSDNEVTPTDSAKNGKKNDSKPRRDPSPTPKADEPTAMSMEELKAHIAAEAADKKSVKKTDDKSKNVDTKKDIKPKSEKSSEVKKAPKPAAAAAPQDDEEPDAEDGDDGEDETHGAAGADEKSSRPRKGPGGVYWPGVKSDSPDYTVLCDFWHKRGNCKFGQECKRAHGTDNMRVPCRKYLDRVKLEDGGSCKYGETCKHYHPPTPAWCRHDASPDGCSRKKTCKFSHRLVSTEKPSPVKEKKKAAVSDAEEESSDDEAEKEREKAKKKLKKKLEAEVRAELEEEYRAAQKKKLKAKAKAKAKSDSDEEVQTNSSDDEPVVKQTVKKSTRVGKKLQRDDD